jgi:hypothetical protein
VNVDIRDCKICWPRSSLRCDQIKIGHAPPSSSRARLTESTLMAPKMVSTTYERVTSKQAWRPRSRQLPQSRPLKRIRRLRSMRPSCPIRLLLRRLILLKASRVGADSVCASSNANHQTTTFQTRGGPQHRNQASPSTSLSGYGNVESSLYTTIGHLTGVQRSRRGSTRVVLSKASVFPSHSNGTMTNVSSGRCDDTVSIDRNSYL